MFAVYHYRVSIQPAWPITLMSFVAMLLAANCAHISGTLLYVKRLKWEC